MTPPIKAEALGKPGMLDRISIELDSYGARAYETGYQAGMNKAMATLSMTDASRGLTPEFKAELFTMLDRIQLAQKMIATYDTRYSVFGEIIRDFAALIGPADAEEPKEGEA